MFHSNRNIRTFTGEIDRGNCLSNGYTPALLSFLLVYNLNGGIMLTHRLSNHSVYYRWLSLRARCYKPNSFNYPNYGGRGIKVCDEWKSDFKAFYDYVTELPNYNMDLTLDRIDNNGDYEPGNLRWVSKSVQAANRRPWKENRVGAIGVTKACNRYRACIAVKKKRINIGYFISLEDAIRARNNYIIKNKLVGYKIQEVC